MSIDLRATLNFEIKSKNGSYEEVKSNRYYLGNNYYPGKRYSSSQMMVWHIDQAPVLCKAYHEWQEESFDNKRNVLRAMISLIYEKNNSNYMNHFEVPAVFINGWDITDEGTAKINFYEIPNNIPICALRQSSKDLQSVINLSLIPNDANTTEKDNRSKHFHTERSALSYLYIHKDFISKKLMKDVQPNDKIKGLVINIASYRHPCLRCQKLLRVKLNNNNNNNQNQINWRDKIKEAYKVKFNNQDFKITVLQTGIKEYSNLQKKSNNKPLKKKIVIKPKNKKGYILNRTKIQEEHDKLNQDGHVKDNDVQSPSLKFEIFTYEVVQSPCKNEHSGIFNYMFKINKEQIRRGTTKKKFIQTNIDNETEWRKK